MGENNSFFLIAQLCWLVFPAVQSTTVISFRLPILKGASTVMCQNINAVIITQLLHISVNVNRELGFIYYLFLVIIRASKLFYF